MFIVLFIRSVYKFNPLPYFVLNPVSYQEISQETNNSLRFWMEKLKDDSIKVSTTPKLAPFFTNRRFYYNFLYDSAFESMGQDEDSIIKNEIDKYNLADYVIINKQEVKLDLAKKFYIKLKNDRDYKLVFYDQKDIEVFKRVKSS